MIAIFTRLSLSKITTKWLTLAAQIAWKLAGTHGQTHWVVNAVKLRHQFRANIWPRVIPTMPAIIVAENLAIAVLAKSSVTVQLVSTMRNIQTKFVKRRPTMYATLIVLRKLFCQILLAIFLLYKDLRTRISVLKINMFLCSQF